MKKTLLVVVMLAVCVLLGIAVWFGMRPSKEVRILPTYFTYTEAELGSVRDLSSKLRIQSDDLYRSDEAAFGLVAKYTQKKEFSEETSKIYAYLAVAERDFAFLSHNLSGEFTGTTNLVSKAVLCLFFQADCESIAFGTGDTYSQALTDIVMTKVKERMKEDVAGLTPYPIRTGREYWEGPQPSIGLTNGSSKGWFIKSGDAFRAPEPPAFDSEEFQEQLRITQDILKNATPEQKRATVSWAGGPGTKTPPGQLISLGDDYMQGKTIARSGDQYIKGKSISLEKTLIVRSVVAMAIADAVTAVFDSKYTYLVKRPFMMDPTMITVMPTPNHPAYPSGHSTLSMAATTVLTHYFPEDKEMWEEKAKEAGLSRVWGGIHYMMDHDSGVAIGKQVGEAAILGTPWQE